MNTLPLELQLHIIEFACDDDGSTALSLALVSRRVNEISEPFRYQSIAVAGTTALTRFADVLENLPIHRRRVRNLFLSDLTRDESLMTIMKIYTRQHRDATVPAITRIFDVVASTLETLTFMVFMPIDSGYIVRHLYKAPLPCLRELALYGYFPYPTTSPNLLPLLERLHVCGHHNPYSLLRAGEKLAAACPRVREIHFSGLVAAAVWAQELERALFPDEDDEEWSVSPTLPTTVRTVVAGTETLAAKVMRRHVTSHQTMKDCLSGLARRTSLPGYVGARVLCVEDCGDRARYEEWRGKWGK